MPNALCLFERVSGDMLWRHSAETVEGRPKRDLDVDGGTNIFVQDRLETEILPETHARRSVWAVRSAATLLAADDYPRRRAGFIDHHLWVTPYAADELYAAGMYPTLSRPGEGLPRWTAVNRSIDNTDVVLWYTMGMHHVARAEDWPVMPVSWNWFELRPFDFFDGNPSLR